MGTGRHIHDTIKLCGGKQQGDRKDSDQEEIPKEAMTSWGMGDESESAMQWSEGVLSLPEGRGRCK